MRNSLHNKSGGQILQNKSDLGILNLNSALSNIVIYKHGKGQYLYFI